MFFHSPPHPDALWLTQPPIQRVPGALSQGLKQLGHEADHSPSCSDKVKMHEAILPPIHLNSMMLS